MSWTSRSLFGVLLIGATGFGWVSFDQTPPIQDLKVQVVGTDGRIVHIQNTGVRFRLCAGVTSRRLVIGEGPTARVIPFIETEFTNDPARDYGPFESKILDVEIPADVVSGTAVTFQQEIEYRCSFLQNLFLPLRLELPDLHIDAYRCVLSD